MQKKLAHKPLIEAIFELKWHIDAQSGDPNYSIFVGKLFDSLKNKYPYHERLPTSMIPEQLASNVVQHRFRIGDNKWPLVQIGPGIITLNSTADYTWEDFSARVIELVKTTYKVYPNSMDFKVTSLLLRYLDSENYDYRKRDVFKFLKEYLKVNIAIPRLLFQDVAVKSLPKGFNFDVSYPSVNPNGIVNLRFTSALKNSDPAVMWAIGVQSINKDLPKMPGQFSVWLKAAHVITDNWFFNLIEGELERRYSHDS